MKPNITITHCCLVEQCMCPIVHQSPSDTMNYSQLILLASLINLCIQSNKHSLATIFAKPRRSVREHVGTLVERLLNSTISTHRVGEPSRSLLTVKSYHDGSLIGSRLHNRGRGTGA